MFIVFSFGKKDKTTKTSRDPLYGPIPPSSIYIIWFGPGSQTRSEWHLLSVVDMNLVHGEILLLIAGLH